MARGRDYIPEKDVEFHPWQKNLREYTIMHSTSWNVPAGVFAALETLGMTWDAAYATASKPETRTSAAVLEKNNARKALVAEIRKDVAAYITSNPDVPTVDRENMHLPIHKTTRTRSPIAITYPDFDVDSSVIRRLTIHFYDQGSISKAKPEGQHGAEIRWAICDIPPVDVSELVHSSFDTRTPFTLEFEGHQRGKTAYFCLCWENTRGEKGPWSKIQSAIIP
jgi:hypothetical protein